MSLTVTQAVEETSFVGHEAVAESVHGAAQPSVNGNGQTEGVEQRELKAILEAVLFVSSDPVPIARLLSILGAVKKADLEQALTGLKQELEQDGRGVQLVQVAGGYRLMTKPDYAPWVKKLDKAKTLQKLSRSALESLAIIAYKQPLVRSEIEQIRGVETSGVLRTLLERKLVRIVGRKEVPGRPIMYGTTKFFLEHFGLQDLSQLPPLREFKELGDAEQALLPMEEEKGHMDSSMLDQESESQDIPLDLASPMLTQPVEQVSHS